MLNASNKENDINYRINNILLTDKTKISKHDDVMKKLKEYQSKTNKEDYIITFDFEFKTLHAKQQLYIEYKPYFHFNVFQNENNILSFIHSIALIIYNKKTNEVDILHIFLPYFNNSELLTLFEEFKSLTLSGGSNTIASNIIEEPNSIEEPNVSVNAVASVSKSTGKTRKTKSASTSSKSIDKSLNKKIHTSKTNVNDYFVNLEEYLKEIKTHHAKGKGKGKGKGVKDININSIDNINQMIQYDTQFYFLVNFKGGYFKRPFINQMKASDIDKVIEDFNKDIAIKKEKIRDLYELLHSLFSEYELLNKGLKDFIIFYNCYYFFTKQKFRLTYPSNYVNNFITLNEKTGVRLNRTNINSIYRDYDFDTGYKFKKFKDYWNQDETNYYERFHTLDVLYNYYVYDKNNFDKLIKLLSALKSKTNTKKKEDAITIEYIIDKVQNYNLPEHIALDDTIKTFCIYLLKKNNYK